MDMLNNTEIMSSRPKKNRTSSWGHTVCKSAHSAPNLKSAFKDSKLDHQRAPTLYTLAAFQWNWDGTSRIPSSRSSSTLGKRPGSVSGDNKCNKGAEPSVDGLAPGTRTSTCGKFFMKPPHQPQRSPGLSQDGNQSPSTNGKTPSATVSSTTLVSPASARSPLVVSKDGCVPKAVPLVGLVMGNAAVTMSEGVFSVPYNDLLPIARSAQTPRTNSRRTGVSSVRLELENTRLDLARFTLQVKHDALAREESKVVMDALDKRDVSEAKVEAWIERGDEWETTVPKKEKTTIEEERENYKMACSSLTEVSFDGVRRRVKGSWSHAVIPYDSLDEDDWI